MRRRTFTVDKADAKMMGVCAGLANMMAIDATIVRIGFVLATLLGGFPWTVIAYFALGLIGQPKHGRLQRSAPARETLDDPREMRDLDRRMAEIDTYVASSNSRLAREIEELR